jgi:hypothetical protein
MTFLTKGAEIRNTMVHRLWQWNSNQVNILQIEDLEVEEMKVMTVPD